MSCCGDERSALRHDPLPAGARGGNHWVPASAEFVFSGQGQLIVTGPMTGIVYRFSGGAPPVRVHGSDVASLVSVPGLRLSS